MSYIDRQVGSGSTMHACADISRCRAGRIGVVGGSKEYAAALISSTPADAGTATPAHPTSHAIAPCCSAQTWVMSFATLPLAMSSRPIAQI